MRSWSVTARGLAAVQVQGRNWIVALGRGLEELGRVPDLTRLACEVLPNGTVIARDIATGTGYVVMGMEEAESRPEPAEDTAEAETVEAALPLADEDDDASDEDSLVELPLGSADEDDEQDGDASVEPIFELPADAIELVEDSPNGAILDAETVSQACQLALDSARRQIPAESGAVILEERGYLRFLAVDGPASRKLVGVRLPLGTGAAGFAMEKRRTVVLANAHEDPRHCGEVDALTGYVTREMCVVPVLHGDKVLGVLELMNLTSGQRFGDAEIETLTGIASTLAERLAH
ncbi:MAG: GAF domain-containing protein [Myxococcales bacterium]|nr:GAF domain-containing protein [Myxococcales bacterium]